MLYIFRATTLLMQNWTANCCTALLFVN